MSRHFLYRLLESPLIYSIGQKILAPGGERKKRDIYRTLFANSSGLILDLGCGPVLRTPPPKGTIVGIDINRYYISRYIKPQSREMHQLPGWQERDTIKTGVVSDGAILPFGDEVFDECRCMAALHHFEDELAQKVVREMLRVTRQGGRIVIFDGVWPKSGLSSPLSWLVCKFDRGERLRTEEELLKLVHLASESKGHRIRFTYGWTKLDGIVVVVGVQ